MDIDVEVARLTAMQHGVLSTRQIRGLGGDHRLIARRRTSNRWELVTSRVIRIVGTPEDADQRLMVAVLDAGPDAVASHEAAAWLWHLPGFGPTDVVLRRRDAHAIPVAGTGHRPKLVLEHHRTVLRGIPCTAVPRTIFDLASLGLHPQRMHQLVNSLVTKSPAMLPALHRTLEELACRGRPGITVMREILDANPVGSKVPASGLEARVLQIARNAGIYELECQVDVGGHSWLGRVDFAIIRLRLLIEVDSVVHHSSPMDVARDHARDEAMLAEGWAKVLRIREEDVWPRPYLVAQQLRDAIRELEALLGTEIDRERAGFHTQNR